MSPHRGREIYSLYESAEAHSYWTRVDHNLGNPDAEKGMHTRFHRTLYGVSSVSVRLEVTDLIPLKDDHTTTSAKGLDPLSYEFGAGNGLRVIFARSLSLGSIPSRSTKLAH